MDRSVRAVVVGGGLAGVAASVVLAERGVAVTLLEREGYLGGRAGAWTDQLAGGQPFEMSRGFHAFFRQYHNLRALLRRVDPRLSNLQGLDDYRLLGPEGAEESFTGLPRRPPFNAIALMFRSPTIGLRDLPNMDGKAAREMLRFDQRTTYDRMDHQTAGSYLESLRLPDPARRMLFGVFARSFFDPEDEMSAAELLMRFHLYFMGTSEGLLFDVTTEPFSDSLWRPLRRYLDQLGVEVKMGTEVQALDSGPPWRVHSADSTHEADAVVMATTVQGLQQVVAASADLGPPAWRSAVSELRRARPFAVWRLWLDRPTWPGRPPFAGTAGLGLIDNISLLHLYEGESRRWALRTGGAVVELHAYSLPTGWRPQDVKVELLSRLHQLYPETADVEVLEDRFLVADDAPAFPPGSYANRPGVVTPVAGLVLAGDFVHVNQPAALMERAVTSGMLGANALLRGWGCRPAEVLSVAPRGLLAPPGTPPFRPRPQLDSNSGSWAEPPVRLRARPPGHVTRRTGGEPGGVR